MEAGKNIKIATGDREVSRVMASEKTEGLKAKYSLLGFNQSNIIRSHVIKYSMEC